MNRCSPNKKVTEEVPHKMNTKYKVQRGWERVVQGEIQFRVPRLKKYEADLGRRKVTFIDQSMNGSCLYFIQENSGV